MSTEGNLPGCYKGSFSIRDELHWLDEIFGAFPKC